MKEEILRVYDEVSLNYGYNSNSLHKLGLDARRLENAASRTILEVLDISNYDVIYTSGNAESFTYLINNVKKRVLTDNNSIISICKELSVPVYDDVNKYEKGDFVSCTDSNFFEGKINHIDIKLDREYADLNKYDFITIEDEIPFFGVLIKRKNIELENLIHGGKSTTKYRSGTSVTPLIVSFAKLVKLKYKK